MNLILIFPACKQLLQGSLNIATQQLINIYLCIYFSNFCGILKLQLTVYSRPSQGGSQHFMVSTAGPLQFFPPQDGSGLLQLLVFSLTQDTEQFPSNQSDHPPSTVKPKHLLLTTQIFSCLYLYTICYQNQVPLLIRYYFYMLVLPSQLLIAQHKKHPSAINHN